VVNVMPWPHFTPGKDPVPIVQEAGWTPGPVCTGTENLAPTRIFFYIFIRHYSCTESGSTFLSKKKTNPKIRNIGAVLVKVSDIRGVTAGVQWCIAYHGECRSSKYLPVGLRLLDR
jgi:hypothetical protein